MATIVTKNSSTASAVPTTSDLVQGELAVNVTDKRIFTENASTQIVELGTNPSTITTATATVTGTLTANGTFASNNAVITGGSINSTPIGATTPSTVRGSTVTATTGFVGGLTGNVTGNLTGNVTGNVVGNLTGNVTGNVTASTGTTTLNNLVVNGTADFTNTKLTNITTPTASTDAANKGYVDATVAAVIDSAPAALDTLNELAAALGDDANFSATVTTALATKLPLAGGTMTGAIAMGTSKITGLGDPTASQDAATKTYVDTADATKLNLSGGTMSGAIAMGTNKITGLGDPTLAQDAATKAYTDSILGSATSAAASAAAAATSESNAATSASNAATSETNALNSANAAASSYDQFDDRYLGDKASDPTLDNDGNALLTGALYFNTTTDVMRVYNGSAWQDTAISPNSPTFTGTVTADGLSLGDNDKATFGDGNDLEIYHNGSGSYVSDQGVGPLNLLSGGVRLKDTTDTGTMLAANAGGAVTLYYNNAAKLATTATGIDVTGTATMDGLTVDGNTTIDGTLLFTGSTNRIRGGLNQPFSIDSRGNATGEGVKITHNSDAVALFDINGDISFYEDTGTTPKFFWDASAESLGIGTSSPAAKLEVNAGSTGTDVNTIRMDSDSGGAYNILCSDASSSTPTWKHSTGINEDVQFLIGGNDILYLDASGNVGIGTSSPSTALSGTATVLEIANVNVASVKLSNTGAGAKWELASINDGSFRIYDDNAEKLRIDSAGNVGIGEAPNSNSKLQILDTAATANNYTVHMRSYQPTIVWNDISGASTDFAIQVDTSAMIFQYGDAGTGTKLASEAMRIDSSGNVGIGTSSPTEKLSVRGIGSQYILIQSDDNSGSGIYFGNTGSTDRRITLSSSNLLFENSNGSAEYMRLDSSGNLLVGTSSAGIGDAGIELRADGQITGTRDGNIAALFNRLTSNGEIVQFRKDGTTVGSIGVGNNNRLNIGTGDTGLMFDATNNAIFPWDISTNAVPSTDRIDLGYNLTGLRFKDLYLSGTANVANVKETVYALTGTALDAGNGGIQTKTLAANTTFTDSLASGESLVLQLEAGASYTVTWPTMTWVTSGGNTAPTLTAKDTLVFWKVSSTLYGAYTGSYV